MATRDAELVKEILGYLRSHRHAAETVEGVHSCWVGGVDRWTAAQVGKTLERLAHSGRIERHVLPDGEFLYRAVQRGART